MPVKSSTSSVLKWPDRRQEEGRFARMLNEETVWITPESSLA